jgi:hypothetical protein
MTPLTDRSAGHMDIPTGMATDDATATSAKATPTGVAGWECHLPVSYDSDAEAS